MDSAGPDSDRRLGDAWSGWTKSPDADTNAPDTRSSKRLFLASAPFLLITAGLACVAGFYFLSPRLRTWGEAWVTFFACALAAAWGTGALLFAGLVVTLSVKPGSRLWRFFPRHLPLLFFRPSIRFFSRLIGGDADRLAHSFIRVHNAWEERASAPVTADRVLVLLPRCLSGPQMELMKEKCRSAGVSAVVVSGGEAAREAVREKKPAAVIGVACERDLLSGIRDLHPRISVIGLPNFRPEGPCRNTQADAEELGRVLSRMTRPSGSGPGNPT
ncbi:MAG: DUF116 domain-containing protein [bacterium]|nr:DUF116 domain-containing protein [bacterium]